MTREELMQKKCPTTMSAPMGPRTCIGPECALYRERSMGNRTNPPLGPDRRWLTFSSYCGLGVPE